MKNLGSFVVSWMVVATSLGGASRAAADTTSSFVVAQLSAGQTGSEPLSGKAATSISNPRGAGELEQIKDIEQREAAPVRPHVDRLAVRSRQCVELPFQYTAQGDNLDQQSVQCKSDCSGQATVTAQKRDNGITCRYEGTWDADQSCQVGVTVAGSWTRRLIRTCGGGTLAAARTPKATSPTTSGAATSTAPEIRKQGSLLQSQARSTGHRSIR